jgi:hypothetical protein
MRYQLFNVVFYFKPCFFYSFGLVLLELSSDLVIHIEGRVWKVYILMVGSMVQIQTFSARMVTILYFIAVTTYLAMKLHLLNILM